MNSPSYPIYRRRWVVCVVGLVLAACGSFPDPRTGIDPQLDGYGSWIEVTRKDQQVLRGELLAVTERKLYLLTKHGEIRERGGAQRTVTVTKVRTVQVQDLVRADVYCYEPNGYGLSFAVTWVPFFVPVTFLLVFVGNSLEESKASATYRPANLVRLTRWARFPQGLPPNLDPKVLLKSRWPMARAAPRAPTPVAPARY